MITDLLLNLIVTILATIFSLPFIQTISKLPSVNGYDIDSMIGTGMASLHSLWVVFWPIQDMFYGFLFLMLYYMAKIALKFFLGGNRTPGKH